MAEEDNSKILRFNSDTHSPTHQESGKKYQATAKYDRKALKKRLEVEEWLHYELKRLYQCEEGQDYGIEIDLDILANEKCEEKQVEMLTKILHSAKEPLKDFIKELLEKVKTIDDNVLHKPANKEMIL